MNQESESTQSVVVECELPEPPEKVWRALTESALLARWLLPNDIRPEVGNRFRFQAGCEAGPGEGTIIKTKRRLNEIYAKHCGRTYDEVDKTLDRDHFMTAEEAKSWGLVDHVYSSREGIDPPQTTSDAVTKPWS